MSRSMSIAALGLVAACGAWLAFDGEHHDVSRAEPVASPQVPSTAAETDPGGSELGGAAREPAPAALAIPASSDAPPRPPASPPPTPEPEGGVWDPQPDGSLYQERMITLRMGDGRIVEAKARMTATPVALPFPTRPASAPPLK